MPDYKLATAAVLAALALTGCDKTPSDAAIISYHNKRTTAEAEDLNKLGKMITPFNMVIDGQSSTHNVVIKVLDKSLSENGKVTYSVLDKETKEIWPYRTAIVTGLTAAYDFPMSMTEAQDIPFNPPESAMALGFAVEKINTKEFKGNRGAERVILKHATRTKEEQARAEKLLMECGETCKPFITEHRGTFFNYLNRLAIKEALLDSAYFNTTENPEVYIKTTGGIYKNIYSVDLMEFK